jgi:dolichol-phosphate mannosyltransferase
LRPRNLKSPLSITIVVPVYNEAALVADSSEKIVSFFREKFAGLEVILVESGSTDGTGALCDEVAERYPEVRVIHEGARNGFGSAVKLGFAAATRDLVAMVTFDLPFPLESIAEAATLVDRYDCVLSYRSVDGRKSQFRKLQSWVFDTSLRKALGLRTRHLNSALKVYRREIIQSLPLTSKGWLIDTEIVYWLEKRSVRCTQIPVPLVERTVGKSSTGLMAPIQILREAWRFKRAQRDGG